MYILTIFSYILQLTWAATAALKAPSLKGRSSSPRCRVPSGKRTMESPSSLTFFVPSISEVMAALCNINNELNIKHETRDFSENSQCNRFFGYPWANSVLSDLPPLSLSGNRVKSKLLGLLERNFSKNCRHLTIKYVNIEISLELTLVPRLTNRAFMHSKAFPIGPIPRSSSFITMRGKLSSGNN